MKEVGGNRKACEAEPCPAAPRISALIKGMALGLPGMGSSRALVPAHNPPFLQVFNHHLPFSLYPPRAWTCATQSKRPLSEKQRGITSSLSLQMF